MYNRVIDDTELLFAVGGEGDGGGCKGQEDLGTFGVLGQPGQHEHDVKLRRQMDLRSRGPQLADIYRETTFIGIIYSLSCNPMKYL